MAEDDIDPAVLIAQVELKRARLADNLDELSIRLAPANLVQTGLTQAREAAQEKAGKAMRDVNALLEDMTSDGLDWARDNRTLLIGGAAVAVAAAVAAGARASRAPKPVPLYAAYNQEYRMTAAKDDAATAWNKVKGEAELLGDRAGEAYYSARSKAAGAAVTAREAAHEAADTARAGAQHAADMARERAHDAAIKAREAAERAREAAGEAGEWARRQPDENPISVVIVGIAIGAIIGALLPRTSRENAMLGSARDDLKERARVGMQQAVDAATASLEGAGITTDNARSKLDTLLDAAKNIVGEAGTAAAQKLRTPS